MPEVSRFFGIIIRMFVEAGGQHHMPSLPRVLSGPCGNLRYRQDRAFGWFLSEAPGAPCSGLGRASSGRVIVELADVATGPAAH
jgi:hypothetical protein